MVSKHHIRSYDKRVGMQFRPERVILFGSYARGRATADSDVDLLVIMDHDKSRNIEQSIEIQLATGATFPMNLIVRRPVEVHDRLSAHDSFIKGILADGEVLYG